MTAIEENYINNHPRSSEFYQKSKTVFSSGVTHDTRYVSPFPIVIEKQTDHIKRILMETST